MAESKRKMRQKEEDIYREKDGERNRGKCENTMGYNSCLSEKRGSESLMGLYE